MLGLKLLNTPSRRTASSKALSIASEARSSEGEYTAISKTVPITYFFLCTRWNVDAVLFAEKRTKHSKRKDTYRCLLDRVNFSIHAGDVDHIACKHRNGLHRRTQPCSPEDLARSFVQGSSSTCLNANCVRSEERRVGKECRSRGARGN